MTVLLLFSLGTYIFQIQSVWVNFACTKRLLKIWAEGIVNARIARLRVKCAIFRLKIKQIPFSCRLVKGFTFLKRAQNQFKIKLEMSSVLASIVPNWEKCESLGGYVTTPKSVYSCGKCAAWLFVHEVLFMLQEHVKTTKTDKTRFFVKERRTWYPTNNCYSMSQFNQPNKERKNCVWTTK